MLDGFIKIAAATPVLTVGDCEKNAEIIINTAKEAAQKGAKLIVFPQLCITGCTCGDLFLQNTLIKGATDALIRIAQDTRELDAAIVVGLPVLQGHKLYNCAAVLNKGTVCGITPQTVIHRQHKNIFTSAETLGEDSLFTFIGDDFADFCAKQIFVCESMEEFTFGIEIGADATSAVPMSAHLAEMGANIIINLACEPEIMGAPQHRFGLCASQSARLRCTYVYVGAGTGESSGDNVYSGACLAAEEGRVLAQKSLYEDGFILFDADAQKSAALRLRDGFELKSGYRVCFDVGVSETALTRRLDSDPFRCDGMSCEAMLDIQAMGLKRRLEHIHSDTAVIGISGGLDSTLAILATVRAFDLMKKDRKGIIAVTMPCFGTSSRTKSNAVKLCEELGVTLISIDIKKAVSSHFKDIGHDPSNTNVVYENAQARERTQILMDIANAKNGIVIGTGDLSELALGFATYNGDHMSMYGVNASLPKTLIRHMTSGLADIFGGKIGKILKDIVDTPVSPELLPPENGVIAQKTEDIVGAYELHDFFIYYMMHYGFGPKKIFRMACNAFEDKYDRAEILRCMKTFYRRFFTQQYKRSCLPDGVQVSTVSFSPRTSWSMPSDACGALWLKETENIE